MNAIKLLLMVMCLLFLGLVGVEADNEELKAAIRSSLQQKQEYDAPVITEVQYCVGTSASKTVASCKHCSCPSGFTCVNNVALNGDKYANCQKVISL